MEHTVIKMMEEVKKLVENEKLNPAVDAEDFLEYLLYLIQDSIKWNTAINYLTDAGPSLPFDAILKLNEIAGWHSIEKIEFEWKALGFNDWYKETYGITVEEASREKKVLK